MALDYDTPFHAKNPTQPLAKGSTSFVAPSDGAHRESINRKVLAATVNTIILPRVVKPFQNRRTNKSIRFF